jgi:hypothetical protein
MPYRKTRKLKRKQRQRKQKGGAGFLSLFQKQPDLPYESYKSAINRLFLALYSHLNAAITPNYIPLSSNQTMLTAQQKEVFRKVLRTYVSKNTNGKDIVDEERFAREALGFESLDALNKEIQKVEAVGQPIQDVVLLRPAKAESYAGYFGRIYPVILSSDRTVNYRQNWEQNICAYKHEINQNIPIRSLQENRCIVILHNKKHWDIILSEYQLVYGDTATIGPGFPYILVDEKFFPQMNNIPFPYTRINASKLMNVSYVLDAFQQGGIQEIQPDLAKVIAQEYKELWNSYSIVQIRKLSAIQGINFHGDRFLIVNEDSPLIPGTILSLSKIPATTILFGFDPRTSCKLRTEFPSLWKQSIEDPNFSFFVSLSPTEQLKIAVLQYIQFLKRFPIQKTKAVEVYSLDLRSKDFQRQLMNEVEIDKAWEYQAIFNKLV